MHDERVDMLKDESLPQLLKQLATETTTLVRQEIELAKAELNEKVKVVGASAAMFGIAAIFGLGAFAAFTTVLITLLALVMPVWAGALIVLIVYSVVALVAAQRGRAQLVGVTTVPEQTAKSLKEDVAWVKTRTQSSKR